MKKEIPYIYQNIFINITCDGRDEITIKEFKEILQKFRITKNMWFQILKEMESMYKIKFNGKKICVR